MVPVTKTPSPWLQAVLLGAVTCVVNAVGWVGDQYLLMMLDAYTSAVAVALVTATTVAQAPVAAVADWSTWSPTI